MFSDGLFPQKWALQRQIERAPFLAVAIILAVAHACRPGCGAGHRILLLSLLAPLATVAVYRNAFPYHFAFILPPAMVAVAPAISPFVRRFGAVPPAALLLPAPPLLPFSPAPPLFPPPPP